MELLGGHPDEVVTACQQGAVGVGWWLSSNI